VSYTELRDGIDLGDYYCLLAEALDAEELDDYKSYLLAGGDKKKWKWQSPDKAGTVPIIRGKDSVVESMSNIAKNVFNVDISSRSDVRKRKGSGREFAEVTGRPWVMMNPDGVFFDKNVNVITPPFDDGTVIIKIDYNGNEI